MFSPDFHLPSLVSPPHFSSAEDENSQEQLRNKLELEKSGWHRLDFSREGSLSWGLQVRKGGPRYSVLRVGITS